MYLSEIVSEFGPKPGPWCRDSETHWLISTQVSDLSSEFQREREEMLDTIRQLARQIKLKDLILEGFAPAHKVKALEERAEWDPVWKSTCVSGALH